METAWTQTSGISLQDTKLARASLADAKTTTEQATGEMKAATEGCPSPTPLRGAHHPLPNNGAGCHIQVVEPSKGRIG